MTVGERAPEYRVPDSPTIGGSFREALQDFYFNSVRLVPANILWAVSLIAVLLAGLVYPLAAIPGAILLALPTAGVFRMATLIAREERVELGDAIQAMRTFLGPALMLGSLIVAASIVLGVNLVVALSSTELLTWSIGTMAAWGLLALWTMALPAWSLLVDPVRSGDPWTDRVRLAASLVLLAPLRFALLWLLMTVLLIVSVVLFAAVITVAIAFIALVVTRYTLPAADRLEQRQTHLLPQ